jgi:deoxycytidylate deaminase
MQNTKDTTQPQPQNGIAFSTTNAETATAHPALQPFQIYGWQPDPTRSNDDNFLDLVLLVTRNSTCRNGSMGCLIVKPATAADAGAAAVNQPQSPQQKYQTSILNSIVAASINQPLYTQNESDIHAEVSVIGKCAKQGLTTAGCTAYITMPPCKNCLGALVAAGIKRIVCRCIPDYLRTVAQTQGIQLPILDHASEAQRKQHVERIIANFKQDQDMDDQEEIQLRRKERKEEKQERKRKRMEKLGQKSPHSKES